MPERTAPIVVTPRACPFVALDGDRDRRLDAPDPLHRCFAEPIPRARSVGHQADYCLSTAFAACPIFQDWATRAAAEPLAPRFDRTPTAATPIPTATAAAATAAAATAAAATGATTPPIRDASLDATQLRTDALAATRPYVPPPDEELTSSRPVPSYRATPALGHPAATLAGAAVGSPPSATPGPASVRPGEHGGATAPDQPSGDPAVDDDVPVIRSIPVPLPRPALSPDDEDWMAPPPWLRQPSGPVWVAEAVPPPDALADVGTQGLRRPRPDEALPSVLAEAAIPEVHPGFGGPSPFGDETTGAPQGLGMGGASGMVASAVVAAPVHPGAIERAPESAATGTQGADLGTSAEVAASRYRSDLLAGLEPDDTGAVDLDDRSSSSPQRRVPIDVSSSAALGPQARPSGRSTGSREWEGPRRFEAYAATQRRRLPMGVLVGGGAAVLAVLLVGVFLLPGLLMGGGPAPTATPADTSQVAAVDATAAPTAPPSTPEATERPEKTPKPKTYTVKAGDTLIKIAKRNNTTVAKIQCLNHIKNPNNVAVGRTLTIPPKGYRCPD